MVQVGQHLVPPQQDLGGGGGAEQFAVVEVGRLRRIEQAVVAEQHSERQGAGPPVRPGTAAPGARSLRRSRW